MTKQEEKTKVHAVSGGRQRQGLVVKQRFWVPKCISSFQGYIIPANYTNVHYNKVTRKRDRLGLSGQIPWPCPPCEIRLDRFYD